MNELEKHQKLTKRICFACSEEEFSVYQSVWSNRQLSKTIRILLNAAATRKVQQQVKR